MMMRSLLVGLIVGIAAPTAAVTIGKVFVLSPLPRFDRLIFFTLIFPKKQRISFEIVFVKYHSSNIIETKTEEGLVQPALLEEKTSYGCTPPPPPWDTRRGGTYGCTPPLYTNTSMILQL